MITWNAVGGDGNDVFMWTQKGGSKYIYDVSKLAQWRIVFDHMESKGVACHFLTQEHEVENQMSGLNTERKIYFRELVARFGSLNAVFWNLGEETNESDANLISYGDYIQSIQPINHTTSFHTHFDQANNEYNGVLNKTEINATSIQSSLEIWNNEAIDLRQRSAQNGAPKIIWHDEMGSGVQPNNTSSFYIDRMRHGHADSPNLDHLHSNLDNDYYKYVVGHSLDPGHRN